MSSLFDKFMQKRNTENSSRPPSSIEYVNEEPTDSDNIGIEANIFGHVQGVGFRYMTKQLADDLGVVGQVKNETDGSVYVQAFAEKDTMDKFISELSNSPSPSGRVEQMKVKYLQDIEITEKENFKITN